MEIHVTTIRNRRKRRLRGGFSTNSTTEGTPGKKKEAKGGKGGPRGGKLTILMGDPFELPSPELSGKGREEKTGGGSNGRGGSAS